MSCRRQTARSQFYYDWDDVPVLLDVTMAARLLGYDCESIKVMCRSGRLPGFKVGKEWRINKSDIMRMAGVPSTGVPSN